MRMLWRYGWLRWVTFSVPGNNSYDGGESWSENPTLIQGKNGERGSAGSDANVNFANIKSALQKAASTQSTFITADEAGAPTIYGGKIYGAEIYAGTGEDQNFARMTGDGFEVYQYGIATPKFRVYVTDSDDLGPEAVRLSMGSGDQNAVGRFHIIKGENFVNLYYQTSQSGSKLRDTWCGFQLNNDRTIDVYGSLQVNAVWAD